MTPSITPTPESRLGVDQGDLDGVEIEVWHAWFGAPASLFELQAAEFNESNPWGITVRAAAQGSYNSLFNRVTDALESSDHPDVVVGLPEQALVWDANGAVLDLTPYVRDPLWGFDKADLADFPNVFLSQDRLADRWLALPAQRSARFLLYNQTWGRELGFDSPPSTRDEFQEQACAANQSMRMDDIKDNDGKGGWIVDNDSMSVLSWMLAFGGGPLQDDHYRFLGPENIAAFKFLKSLYDEQCAWLSTEVTPYEQFAARSALFVTAGLEEFSDQARAFAQAGSADEWTAIAFPGTEKSGLAVYGSSYVLLESTDARQLAAWLFVRWMLSPENQTRWVKSTGLFPLRVSSLDALSEYAAGHPQWAAAVELIPQAQIQPQLVSWRRVRPILGDAFDHIFRVNVVAGSVSAVLAQMDSTAAELSK
ncbi:MAG: extracellular solute-binding protein [Chloroflexi bacterium]|nr:extracellular solute-binding protein [Chloroflexota bacterium]